MQWRGRISLTLALTLIAATSLGQGHSTPAAEQPAPQDKAAASATPRDKATAPAAADAKPTKSPPEPAAKPKPVPPEEKWLYPAQRLSADLESQAWRTRRDMHAIATGTLGAAWWKQDRAAAERWIYPAVDEVTIASQDEALVDSVRRLDAARRLLALITPLDPILRERLKDVVRSGAARDRDRRSAGPQLTADALVIAAENAGPPQLARAVSDALQYAVTPVTVSAILGLRGQLPDEAEQLFSRALSQAMSSDNPEDIRAFSLFLTAPAGADIPQQWRQQAANAYARALGNGSHLQNGRCALASESATLPKEAGAELLQALASATAECMLGGDPVLAADAQALQRSNPQTWSDYLAVAGESRSPSSRYQLKLKAAEKAEKEATQNDERGDEDGPVRALRILDSMTPEERAVRPGEYKRIRSDVAVRAALYTIGRAGCSAGLRIADNSPRETVLHIAVGVAEKVVPPCYRDAVEIALRQMRRIPAEDPNDYVRLINLVVRRGPYPEQTLPDILRAMDGWKEQDPKTLAPGELTYQAPWNSLRPMPLASELFDISAEVLSAIARGPLRNELLRVDFELHLVRGFLDRYAREINKPKAEVTSKEY